MNKEVTKIDIDWDRIEIDYRAGILTLREIASQHSISHVSISKRAKKEKWPRDLKAKIQARAEALVTKQMVTKEVNSQKAVSEQEAIEGYALAISTTQFKHNSQTDRSQTVFNNTLAEIEAMGNCTELLKQLGNLLIDTTEDADTSQAKRLELFNRIIALPSRVDMLKKLAETLKVLIGLEREAFGLNNEAQDKPKELSHAELDDKLSKLLRKAGYVPANAGQTLQ